MLTNRAEEILRTIHFYRYVTAEDITYSYFSPKSLTYVSEILFDLSGRADHQPTQYLYRFPLSLVQVGKKRRVYTLGTRGRDYLLNEVDLSVDWYFQPKKIRYLSFGYIMYALCLTRFLIALKDWVKTNPKIKIQDLKISYELEKKGLKKSEMVIPDAWILLQYKNHKIPILLEIDRGNEYKPFFKDHIKSRIDYVRSGRYEEDFNTEAVLIAYATTGQFPEYQETRLKSIVKWTLELLREMKIIEWASVFRFCHFEWNNLYTDHLFDQSVWYQPNKPNPIRLLGE